MRHLYIEYNDSLKSFSGLDNLTSIGGYLYIENNDALISMSGLEELISIGGGLGIEGNDSLSSLSGLDNVNEGTISTLMIVDNNSLSDCAVQSICDYLASPNGIVNIGGNSPGCSSQEEVEDACGIVLVDEVHDALGITIFPNPAHSSITLDNSKILIQNAELSIYNVNGLKVHYQQISESRTEINISRLAAGMYIIVLNTNNGVLTEKLVVN